MLNLFGVDRSEETMLTMAEYDKAMRALRDIKDILDRKQREFACDGPGSHLTYHEEQINRIVEGF